MSVSDHELMLDYFLLRSSVKKAGALTSSHDLAIYKNPKDSKIPQDSKRFRKIPQDSTRFHKIPKDSKRFQKISKDSKRF